MYDSNSTVLTLRGAQQRQSTLLYVENNPANLALMAQLIARRKDIQLLTATDGHIGIQKARDHDPDMIILDINLPGSSGFDVFKSLREDPETAHIPIMALSSNAFQREIQKGLTAGFFQYLTKPFKLDELMDAIDAGMRLASKNYQPWIG